MNKRLSEMTDHEINVAVAEKLGLKFSKVKHISPSIIVEVDTFKKAILVNYCKPSAESMQLMIDNKIQLSFDEYQKEWDADSRHNERFCSNENPCRAIAMCFLMTKGREL